VGTTPTGIAYDTAIEAVAGQRVSLDALRTRAATLLSAASIVASFLGAEALSRHSSSHRGFHLTGVEWGAIGSFVALALFCVLILWPWRWTGWHTNANTLVKHWVDAKGKSVEAMQRDLALHGESHYQANLRKMGLLYWCFRLACVLLVAQVILWIIDLAKG
jgi:hypothetical protein